MKSYFQVIIVILLAIPFAYMAFDVFRDLLHKSVTIYWKKAKTILISLLTPIKIW